MSVAKNIDLKELIRFVRGGAKAIEICSFYGCHRDTITNFIKKNSEFSNFSQFRDYHYQYAKASIRNDLFKHAKTSPETARWLACNLMPDEFKMKPQPEKEKVPTVRLIDSKEEINYTKIIETQMKLQKEGDADTLLLDLQTLLPHQKKFLISETTLTFLIAGYGSGKTFGVIRKALYQAFTCLNEKSQRSKGLVVYPTFSLAKELFTDPFTTLLQHLDIYYREDKINKTIFITNVGSIKIHSMQKADRIVGSEYTWAIVDEIDIEKASVAENTHKKIMGRMRGMADAKVSYVGTPEGYKFLYNLAVKKPAEDIDFAEMTTVIRARSKDNQYLEKSYIKTLEMIYDPLMLKRYLNGEFVNLVGLQAFYAFDREKHLKEYTEKRLPPVLYVSMDFNINPMSAEVWDIETEETDNYKRIKSAKNIKEITLWNSNTEEMTNYIKELYPHNKILVFPDRSGASGSTTSNTTDIEIMEKAGFEIIYSRAIIPIRDSLILVNGLLSHNIIQIHPKSIELINDLEQCTTDNEGILNKKDENRTHWSDGLRYMVYMLTEIRRSTAY